MRMTGNIRRVLLATWVILVGGMGWADAPQEGVKSVVPEKVRVLVVTGGHEFDRTPFENMFRAMSEVEATFVPVNQAFRDMDQWKWDAVVFYHMPPSITEKDQHAFLSLLDRGIGVVALHHAIAAWNKWPEYWKIIGARYFLEETEEEGKTWARSTYQHDADIVYRPVKADHPVTAGLEAFTLHDETYKGFRLEPDVEVILEAEHEAAQREAGWIHQYRKSRVCYLQPGHGPGCFSDPHYRQLVEQAILWVSGRRDRGWNSGALGSAGR